MSHPNSFEKNNTINTLITDNIDLWTSAIKKRNAVGRGSSKKIELAGIKKLRELILELAVRGKLVPQDPNDEPASVLLERIAKEKAQLIADKNLSNKKQKQKPLPAITDEEKPFELPIGWEWIKFGDICEIERGGSPRPIKDFITDDTDGFNWIKIGDTDIGGKYITSTAEKIRKEGLKKTRVVYPGDFLLTNSMSFGRPYITKIKGCIHDGWLRISPPLQLDKDYLYSLLSSPFVASAFKKSASGAVVMNLNADKVRAVTIAIPPINEQQRIVAKVDELMALCDQLEQQTEHSLSAHKTLVEVLLAALIQSKNNAEFQQSWQQLNEHFDLLFTTEHSIAQLKQTILQLAVMGKLVPQNPSDEPIENLIDKLYEEQSARKLTSKEKLAVEQEYENAKNSISNNIVLTKARFICDFITKGTTPSKPELLETGAVPFLKVYNIVKNQLYFAYKPIFISEETHTGKLNRSRVFPNDVIMNIVGPPLGKVAVITDEYPEWNMNQALAVFRPLAGINSKYLYYILPTDTVLASVLKEVKGTAGQDNLSLEQCRDLLIPIPSIKQQHIIVELIEDLMALCEQLKARLSDAQSTQLHLADAVVSNALNEVI